MAHYVSRYETINNLQQQISAIREVVEYLESETKKVADEPQSRSNDRQNVVEHDGGLRELLLGKPAEEVPLSYIAGELDVLEYSKLQGAMAATLIALATASMRLRGLDLTGHPFEKEKVRVQQAIEELHSLSDVPNASVNIEAAKRVVRHYTTQRPEVVNID